MGEPFLKHSLFHSVCKHIQLMQDQAHFIPIWWIVLDGCFFFEGTLKLLLELFDFGFLILLQSKSIWAWG